MAKVDLDDAIPEQLEEHYQRSRLSSMEKDEFYDDYEHPPDIKECQLYGKAMEIGIRQSLKDAKDEDISKALMKSSIV